MIISTSVHENNRKARKKFLKISLVKAVNAPLNFIFMLMKWTEMACEVISQP